jgi:hypothetical protein
LQLAYEVNNSLPVFTAQMRAASRKHEPTVLVHVPAALQVRRVVTVAQGHLDCPRKEAAGHGIVALAGLREGEETRRVRRIENVGNTSYDLWWEVSQSDSHFD